MSKSKGNMYDFIDTKWNPLGGKCPHKCKYCSTERFMRYAAVKEKYTGPPRLIEKELKPLGKNKMVFVCSQNDLFADDIPGEIIYKILAHCNKYPDNTYYFQSKNPACMWYFRNELPKKSILCTTIETNRLYPFMGGAPDTGFRAEYMNQLSLLFNIEVTIEPIMDFDLSEMLFLIKICYPKKVNVGADSGHNGLPEPSKEKVLQLIAELEKFTTVYQKSNLARLLK
jgi:hypothetical protein